MKAYKQHGRVNSKHGKGTTGKHGATKIDRFEKRKKKAAEKSRKRNRR